MGGSRDSLGMGTLAKERVRCVLDCWSLGVRGWDRGDRWSRCHARSARFAAVGLSAAALPALPACQDESLAECPEAVLADQHQSAGRVQRSAEATTQCRHTACSPPCWHGITRVRKV